MLFRAVKYNDTTNNKALLNTFMTHSSTLSYSSTHKIPTRPKRGNPFLAEPLYNKLLQGLVYPPGPSFSVKTTQGSK